MNTMHELLLPELVELRIAERHAEAAAERWARQATRGNRPTRTWSLAAVLRLPTLRSGRAAKAV